MGSEQIDYTIVLADMEAKRMALESAIANIRAFLAGQSGVLASGAGSGASTATMPAGEVPAGAFHGKSIPEAASLYLQIMKRKATSREIAEGLKKGGMESISNNFQGIVHACLDRFRKAGGEIVKLDRSTWGLAQWYPAGVRMTTQEKRPAKKKVKAKARTAKRKEQPTVEPAGPVGVPAPNATGPQAIIEAYFAKHAGQAFSNKELTSALNLSPQAVSIVCSKLAHKGKIEKTEDGKFRANHPQAA